MILSRHKFAPSYRHVYTSSSQPQTQTSFPATIFDLFDAQFVLEGSMTYEVIIPSPPLSGLTPKPYLLHTNRPLLYFISCEVCEINSRQCFSDVFPLPHLAFTFFLHCHIHMTRQRPHTWMPQPCVIKLTHRALVGLTQGHCTSTPRGCVRTQSMIYFNGYDQQSKLS